MRFLVTGAIGFIATYVVERLLKDGHQVIGVDNMNNYYDPMMKEWRLKKLQNYPEFSFIKEDVANYKAMEKIFAANKLDVVYNLAARAGVRASLEDPWLYNETNITGTLNLLECCRHYNVNRFVLASTSSLYGATETPFSIENRTDKVHSPYSASKKAAEVLSYTYHYLYGINVNICRYFTVYGPAGRPDMSYFKFMLKIDRGEVLPVFGDGRQSRDFTFVEDVAEATVKAHRLDGYNIMNVGNDSPVELMDMIHIVENLIGKKANIEFLPKHLADNQITWANISETRKLLDWEPKTSLEEGLAKVYEWYQENKHWLRKLNLD